MVSNRNITRRTALKHSAGLVAGLGTTGLASAKTQAPDARQQALEVLRRTGDHDLFEQFLQKRGFEVSRDSRIISLSPEETGPSIQKAESGDLELGGSVYTYNNRSYAHGYWKVWDRKSAWNDWGDEGEPPKDLASISWEHSDYDIWEDTWESDRYSDKYIHEVNGVSWKFNDAKSWLNSGTNGPEFSGWGDVEIQPTNPKSERAIWVNYNHTWMVGRITGVSFDDSGSPSFGFSFDTQRWSKPKKEKIRE